jgi:vitamin-K-epoxide reductase (warfarin-sensitive)
MVTTIFLISAVGFGISVYAYFVEQALVNNQKYKAVCDLSDVISCTKPLLSPYGKLLGFSNTILGMAFYAVMMIAALGEYTLLIWYGALAAIGMSTIFAYLLYFKIQALCLICTSIYVVNVVLLYCAYYL